MDDNSGVVVASESFECACHTHELRAHSDPDWGVEIAYWKMGQHSSHDLRYRFRHIWQIIREGTPYSDFICLDRGDARRFGEFLLRVTEQVERK